MNKRSAGRGARPLTSRERVVLDRIGHDRTHKDIAAELGVSINVANLAAKAYRTLGAHRAAAAMLAHRDAHPWCSTRVDFGPVRDQILGSLGVDKKHHVVERDARPPVRVSRNARNDGRFWSAARVVASTAPAVRSSRLVPTRGGPSQLVRKA